MTTSERVEAAPTDDPHAPAPRRRLPRPTRPAVVSAVLLALLAATVVLLNVSVSRGISPYDEPTHADYALRLAQGGVPAPGDVLAQEVLSEWSCRQGAVAEQVLPACSGGPVDPRIFPARGLQYNAAHPPLYYALTSVGAEALTTVTGVRFLEAARLTGAAWLTAGLWVLLAALRRLRVSWPLATAAGGVVALTPTVMHASSTVTNDAAAVLAGALGLWVALRAVQGQPSWLAFGAASAAVTGFKIIFAVALVPAGVLLLLQLVRSHGERLRLAGVLGAGLVGAAAVAVLWPLVQARRGDPDYVNPLLGFNSRPADGLPVEATLRNLLDSWPPVARPFLQTGLDQPGFALWVALVTLLAGAAPLVAMAAGRSLTGRDVGIGAAVGVVAVPVLVQLSTYASSGQFFPDIAPRYGLALVPALAVAFAHVLRGRRAEVTAIVVVVLGTGAVVSGLLQG